MLNKDSKNKIEVTVVLEIKEIKNENAFEKYLKKEGFLKVEGEEFAYHGFGSTAVMNIRAFVLSVFGKAFEIGNIKIAKLIFQIGQNPFEIYTYEKEKGINEIK